MQNHTVLLHIGYPKTATTWFQTRFFPYVSNAKYISRKSIPEWIFKDISEINREELAKFQDQINDPRIIISEERMVGNIQNMYKNPMKYKEIFPDAEILLLIRNQVDKFASNYSHHILMGGNCSIDRFLFPHNKKELFNGLKHQYDRIIDKYKEAFGEQKVHVDLFENFIASPQKFSDKIIDKYDLKVNVNRISYNTRVNARLSRLGFNLMKGINHFTNNLPPYHRKIEIPKKHFIHIPFINEISSIWISELNNLGLLGKKFSTSKLMGEDNIKFLQDYFAESNQNLIKNHNLTDIQLFNYPL